jgi:hypothetical protein
MVLDGDRETALMWMTASVAFDSSKRHFRPRVSARLKFKRQKLKRYLIKEITIRFHIRTLNLAFVRERAKASWLYTVVNNSRNTLHVDRLYMLAPLILLRLQPLP